MLYKPNTGPKTNKLYRTTEEMPNMFFVYKTINTPNFVNSSHTYIYAYITIAHRKHVQRTINPPFSTFPILRVLSVHAAWFLITFAARESCTWL